MNKILKDFNDYKGFIIAGWMLLWWYFQVIWLLGVWLEYIRFFSSTQIISDWILWVIVVISTLWIFEIWKNNKWFVLTVFILALVISILAYINHFYSIIIFLWIWISATLLYVIYLLFKYLSNLPKLEKIFLRIPKWVSLWIGTVIVLTLFWVVSTKIGTTPSSLYGDDKISSTMEKLGSWTKIQYFNDKYIFLVNDSDKNRKVKILKTEEFLLK